LHKKMSTAALTEGALMTGLTVLLMLLCAYTAVLSLAAMMVLPLPTMVLFIKRGAKPAAVSAVAAILLSMVLMSPMAAISIATPILFAGLPLGWAVREKFGIWKILAIGFGATVLSYGFTFLLSFSVMGINPFQQMLDMYRESIDMAGSIMSGTLGEESADLMMQNYEVVFALLPRIMPVIVLIAAAFSTVLDYVIAKAVLKRFRIHIPALPDVTRVRFPAWVALIFALVYGAGIFAAEPIMASDTFYAAYLNLWYVLFFMMTFAGVMTLWVFLRRYMGKGAAVVVTLLIMMSSLGGLIGILGALDCCMDFRKIKLTGGKV